MKKAQQTQRQPVRLPRPRLKSGHSFEKVLAERRSVREYSSEALTIENVSQLLWSAQGVTRSEGWRTAPSAGETFPLELYLVAGNVGGLAQELYRYRADWMKERVKEVLKLPSDEQPLGLMPVGGR